MMPKGLKQTSSLIVISEGLAESAANTFTSEKVDLQLNALDQEVFVVMGVDIDVNDPELVVGTNTVAQMSISTTERTSVGGIGNTNVLAHTRIEVQNDGAALAIRGEYTSNSAPSTSLEYLGIIATNDFHLNIQGTGNAGVLFGNARLYGYRARADAAIFSSLVQSELLSA
jgi:hypothetical protein